MYKRILVLVFIAVGLLAPTQPQQHTVYVPFVQRQATFKIACQGQIMGIVYEDIDGDGRRDTNEVGMPDVRLTIRPYDQPFVTLLATNRLGQSAMAVRPGRYEMHAHQPDGYRWTTPDSWVIDIECATIQVKFGLELVADPGSIAD
jgi:hypothetical protein